MTDAARLPLNLLDALRALEADTGFRDAMGAPVIGAFLKIKYAEWLSYTAHCTEWERVHTLDV